MKKILTMALFVAATFSCIQASAQNNIEKDKMEKDKMDKKAPEDKSKRPSPPAKVSQRIKSGATISFNYSQPAVKGRMIGKDLEPMEGKVWRTGANEATIFETDRTVSVNGESLPAGKYGFFTVFNGDDVTLIFNKTYNQWGAFKYAESDDQLRVKAKLKNNAKAKERMTFTINKNGQVNLYWGPKDVVFTVK